MGHLLLSFLLAARPAAAQQQCDIILGSPLRVFSERPGGGGYLSGTLPGDFTCPPGRALDCDQQPLNPASACRQCDAGNYSAGGEHHYSAFDAIPLAFSAVAMEAAGGLLRTTAGANVSRLTFTVPPPPTAGSRAFVIVKFRQTTAACNGRSGVKFLFEGTSTAPYCGGKPTDGADFVWSRRFDPGVGAAVAFTFTPAAAFLSPEEVGSVQESAAIVSITVSGALGFASSCLRCPPGFFSPAPGATECTSCPPDTFADKAGAAACSPCRNLTAEWAPAGSTACRQRPLCFQSDYVAAPGPCRSANGRLERDVRYSIPASVPCMVPAGAQRAYTVTVPCACPAGYSQAAMGAARACSPCPDGTAAAAPAAAVLPEGAFKETKNADIMCSGVDVSALPGLSVAECAAACWGEPTCMGYIVQHAAVPSQGEGHNVPWCYLKPCSKTIPDATADAYSLDPAARTAASAAAAAAVTCQRCPAGTAAVKAMTFDGFDAANEAGAALPDGFRTECQSTVVGACPQVTDFWQETAMYSPITGRVVHALTPIASLGSNAEVTLTLNVDIVLQRGGNLSFTTMGTLPYASGASASFSAQPRAGSGQGPTLKLPTSYGADFGVDLPPGSWRLEWRFSRGGSAAALPPSGGDAGRATLYLQRLRVFGTAAGGAAACVPCPAGFSCNAGVAVPAQCSAGSVAAVGAVTCTGCGEADGVAVSAGLAECRRCGNATVRTSATTCAPPCGRFLEVPGVGKLEFSDLPRVLTTVDRERGYTYTLSLCDFLPQTFNATLGLPQCHENGVGFVASYGCQREPDGRGAYSLGSFLSADVTPAGGVVLRLHGAVEGRRSCRRVALVALRCVPAPAETNFTYLGEHGGGGECVYSFELTTPAVCPVCTAYVPAVGPCENFARTSGWVPAPGSAACLSFPPAAVVERCVPVVAYLIGGLGFVFVVLAVLAVAYWAKHKQLSFRYEQLSGGEDGSGSGSKEMGRMPGQPAGASDSDDGNDALELR